jgi:hypothetical protein
VNLYDLSQRPPSTGEEGASPSLPNMLLVL